MGGLTGVAFGEVFLTEVGGGRLMMIGGNDSSSSSSGKEKEDAEAFLGKESFFACATLRMAAHRHQDQQKVAGRTAVGFPGETVISPKVAQMTLCKN